MNEKGEVGKQIPLIVICGPTASGKTALAVSLAKEVGGQIVSADSMQVYRGMDIGTAKPGMFEMDGVAHHMLDVADPCEKFSVARYCEMAEKCIRDIALSGGWPILAGGTGLYISSLTDGVKFCAEENDTAYRTELSKLLSEKGSSYLHGMLCELDPDGAAVLHPNDAKRIIRALESLKTTGLPKKERDRLSKIEGTAYKTFKIGLGCSDREILYKRIDARVDDMIKKGLIDEIRDLLESGVPVDSTAMQAIGYKEFIPFIEGREGLEESLELCKRHSRNYAKRQLTWFRNESDINWIYSDLINDPLKEALSLLDGFLKNNATA